MTKTYCDVCGKLIDPIESFKVGIHSMNIWHANEDRVYQLCKHCARKVKKFMVVIQKCEANHAE